MPRAHRPLTADDLASLSLWQLDATGSAINRSLRFADFGDAFAFMNRVALLAERLDHHPDWRNVYNQLEIRLSTHDAGGLTALDLQMAQAIDRWFAIYASDR